MTRRSTFLGLVATASAFALPTTAQAKTTLWGVMTTATICNATAISLNTSTAQSGTTGVAFACRGRRLYAITQSRGDAADGEDVWSGIDPDDDPAEGEVREGGDVDAAPDAAGAAAAQQ